MPEAHVYPYLEICHTTNAVAVSSAFLRVLAYCLDKCFLQCFWVGTQRFCTLTATSRTEQIEKFDIKADECQEADVSCSGSFYFAEFVSLRTMCDFLFSLNLPWILFMCELNSAHIIIHIGVLVYSVRDFISLKFDALMNYLQCGAKTVKFFKL